MLFIFGGLCIGLIIGMVIAIKDWKRFWEGVGFTVLTMIAGVLVGLLLTILSSGIADVCAEKTYHTVEDTDIYALQDNITTEGRFFLGSGHVDDELKYFYVKQTDVGYTVCNVDADESYIQYTTDRCHVIKQSYTFNNGFVELIAVPMTDRYIFYIPDGSIINNYSIDLA